MAEWISFFDSQPAFGQVIYYYGPPIGVWRGRYEYSPDDLVSPHIIHCDESPGVVDRMDAPWWQPFVGQAKPGKPAQEYPSDYPKELRPCVYTVTVSGREREDGEKPYDYVVEAQCLEDAVRQAVAAHMEDRGDTTEQAEDLRVRCRRGLHEHGYYNDLRMPKKKSNHV